VNARGEAIAVVGAVLAFAHTFPATRHIGLFLREPGLNEAWKGFGSAIAVLVFLASPRKLARIIGRLWTERQALAKVLAYALVVAHMVPALDHVPRFVAAPNWADAWRGFGAVLASAWWTLPVPAQGRVIARATRAFRVAR
jgi:hypothetical protein